MNLKAFSGIQRTKEFIGKSVKKQNPNVVLDMFRENSNYKTFGIKDTSEISDRVIKKLLEKGYSWNTIDSSADRGRAVDLNLLNPITGKLMIGSSSGTAINVLYGINTVGIGTDGGGSVLAPAVGLNLYSALLSGAEIKGKTIKKSTDFIEFTPGVGVITQDFSQLEKVCEIFLTEPQEVIKSCCVMELDSENCEKLKKDYVIDILETKVKPYKRDEMMEFLMPKILDGVTKTIFIGKVADIVENPHGKSIFCVDTGEVMDKLLKEIKDNECAFICANVQETDLAGHQEDATRYGNRLEVVDKKLKKVMELLDERDILIVTADHGNDPNIGHSQHTREKVPVLIYKKGLSGRDIGERKTLSDIGQSVAEYFGKVLPDNGESFLEKLYYYRK